MTDPTQHADLRVEILAYLAEDFTPDELAEQMISDGWRRR